MLDEAIAELLGKLLLFGLLERSHQGISHGGKGVKDFALVLGLTVRLVELEAEEPAWREWEATRWHLFKD